LRIKHWQLFVICALAIGVFSFDSWAYEYDQGVLISGVGAAPRIGIEAPQQSISKDVKSMIQEYVQQTIIAAVLNKIGDVMKRLIENNNLQIMPQVVYLAIQQAGVEIFDQKTMKDMIQAAYDDSVSMAIEKQEKGIAQNIIQNQVSTIVNAKMQEMEDHTVFRQIIEHYLEQALIQNKKIIIQTVAQKQAMLAAIAQQQKAIQMALQQKYLETVQQSMMQQQYLHFFCQVLEPQFD